MRTRELAKKIVYLELLDSLIDGDAGESRARYRLARDFPWLLAEGWDIERWGLRRSKRIPYTTEPRSLRGPTFPLPAFPRVLLPAVVWVTQFVQALRRPRAGVSVAYSPVTGTGAAAARVFRRRSSVLVIRIISDFSARTGALYGRSRESRIIQALEQFVLRRADLVLPMGSFTHQLASRAGVPEDRILELPHPAPWFGTEVIPAERDDPRRVAGAGRLVPDKGFDVLLVAFAEIAEEYPDVILDLAGDGPERSNLQRMATSLGLADRVRFRGWVGANAMPGFFGGASVAVLPSRVNEGLGMVLVEAGLAGCALIGSDVGGIRDIIRPDVTGILAPPNDPGSLADALRTLLQEPKRASRLGAAARKESLAYVGRRDEAIRLVRERIDALRTGGR
jgi:glycosyltransferase involved in cell wall biosynthesis